MEAQPPPHPSPLFSALFRFLLRSGALSGSGNCSFPLLLTALANPWDSAPFHVYFSKPLHGVTLENSPPITRVSVVSVSCVTIIHLMCVMITYLMKATKTYQVGRILRKYSFSWIPFLWGDLVELGVTVFCKSTGKSCLIPKSPQWDSLIPLITLKL